MQHKTWYKQPATEWEEALPVGNGSLGAIVYGGAEHEKIELNNDTLWSGYPRNQNPKNKKDVYTKVQQLTLHGDVSTAQTLIEEQLESAWAQSYLPMGTLHIKTNHKNVKNYERSLDFETATAHVNYECDDVIHKRQVFASYPSKCAVVKLECNKSGALYSEISLNSLLHGEISIKNDTIWYKGVAPAHVEPPYSNELQEPIIYGKTDAEKGMRFAFCVKVICDNGKMHCASDKIVIENAQNITLIICSQTSFVDAFHHPFTHGCDEVKLCENTLKNAITNLPNLYSEHLKDFQGLYSKTELYLPQNKNSTLPTDERLYAFLKDKSDFALYALLFNFGRYLTITASRAGSQATNLQGIWNSQMRPPWSSNFTININTQMNYWPTLPANLLECHEPLVSLVKNLCKTGEVTAREMYGVEGFVSHHNSDIWCHSSPVGNHKKGSGRFAFWNISAAWLCRSLAEQYNYTKDTHYLAEVYPVMRSAALFLKNILLKVNGEYLLCPSTSPENAYIENDEIYYVCKNATMSVAVTKEIFETVIHFASILKIDKAFSQELQEILPKTLENGIGSKGQLLEWDSEKLEQDPKHRHVSHLYGLYPAKQVSPIKTPELAKAHEQSLLLRGDDGTGWSLGWKTCLWARLFDGDHALNILKNQLRPVKTTDVAFSMGGGSYINLFDAHPPMQIDGNFAATAAICEMLLQNIDDEILILPALPSEWTQGKITGICAWNRVQIDISWNEETINIGVYSDKAQDVTLNYKTTKDVAVLDGTNKVHVNFKIQ